MRVEVEMVEMRDWSSGHAEPAEPMWRVRLGGVCADFHGEQGARNFAAQIEAGLAGDLRGLALQVLSDAAEHADPESQDFVVPWASMDQLMKAAGFPGGIADAERALDPAGTAARAAEMAAILAEGDAGPRAAPPPPAAARCPTCGGAGTVWDPDRRAGWPRSVSCPTCDGWDKAQAAARAARP